MRGTAHGAAQRALQFSAAAKRLRGSAIVRLMNDLGDAVNGGGDVQMLGGGNPAAIPQAEQVFRAEMQNLLADGRSFEHMLGNYDAPQGNDALRESLAEYLSAEMEVTVRAENIAVTNGSQASFDALFRLFTGARKKILLPLSPEYIGYGGLAPFTAVRARIEEQGALHFKYRIDFENLPLDSNIGAVCVSRPTNPSGNVITDSELARLRKVARAAGIPLIVDGAYGAPFPGIIFTRATPVWDENMILCFSLSKLGMPGARTGIIVAHRDITARIAESNAVFTLAPGRFGPALFTRLLQSGELPKLCAQTIMPYYRERAEYALQLLREHVCDAGVPLRVHASQGAIFLWLWFARMPIASEVFYARLKKRGVIVVAGEHFFPGLKHNWRHRRECIRITFACAREQLRRGIAIIGEEARRAYDARA